MRDFRGKTALVTGGGSGIGRGLALALGAEGARVVIGDIILDNARAVAAEIIEKGGEALAVHCDVCDRAAISQMRAEANRAFGTVSLLFANAGATSFEKLVDMTPENLDWICQVNLMGVTNCIAEFLPDMIAAGGGHIVATASAAGLNPGWIPYHASYSGAKMGIIGTVLNLRHEIAEEGVGATVLIPFGVETGMKDHNESYRPARFGGPRTEAVVVPEGSFKEIKLHFRQPEEVAPMVLRAVRRNQPMVVTDASQRHVFKETYVDLVMNAFDEAEAYDRENG